MVWRVIVTQYLVMEIQQFEGGGTSTPVYGYDTREKAESKYHQVLSSAAVSSLPIHSAILCTVDGAVLEAKCYRHEIALRPDQATEVE
jgi:hypothetical protein